jgi:hypothetical protein
MKSPPNADATGAGGVSDQTEQLGRANGSAVRLVWTNPNPRARKPTYRPMRRWVVRLDDVVWARLASREASLNEAAFLRRCYRLSATIADSL